MSTSAQIQGLAPSACAHSGGCPDSAGAKPLQTADGLEASLKIAERHLSIAEKRLAEVVAREEKFWNFMSAENLWGLSARLTDDGRPFSAMEVDSLYEYRSELRTIIEGIRSVIKSHETGVEPPVKSPLVQAFMSSPYALPLTSEMGAETLARMANGAAKFAGGFGLPRLSSAIAEDAASALTDDCSKEILRDGMPGWFTRHIAWTARDLGNSLTSADSILFMAAGGGVGRLFGMTGLGQSLGLAAHGWATAFRTTSKAAPVLSGLLFGVLPGSPLWRLAPGAGKLAHVGAAAVNLGWEGAKFAAAAEIAGRTMGDDARWWTERLFLSSAAAHASFSPVWREELATRIASGERNPFFDMLGDISGKHSAWAPILQDIENRTGVQGMMFQLRMNYFRNNFEMMAKAGGKPYVNPVEEGLAKLASIIDDNPSVVPASLMGETKASLMAVSETHSATQIVKRAILSAQGYIKREAKRVAAMKHLTEVELRAQAEAEAAALKKAAGGGTKAKAATEANNQVPSKSVAKKTAQPDVQKDPTRKRRNRVTAKADGVEKSAADSKASPKSSGGKRVKLTAKQTAALDEKIAAPPETLDASEISSLTGKRLSAVNGAADGLAEFYRGAGPRQRVAFWGVVKKLATGEHVGKKTFKGELLYPEGVVWHYHPIRGLRIFYSICDDGIRFFKVERSGNMRTGSTKWKG